MKALAGLMSLVVGIGLMAPRFSHSTARVLFSHEVVLAKLRG
jgi:hypothetical protein